MPGQFHLHFGRVDLFLTIEMPNISQAAKAMISIIKIPVHHLSCQGHEHSTHVAALYCSAWMVSSCSACILYWSSVLP